MNTGKRSFRVALLQSAGGSYNSSTVKTAAYNGVVYRAHVSPQFYLVVYLRTIEGNGSFSPSEYLVAYRASDHFQNRPNMCSVAESPENNTTENQLATSLHLVQRNQSAALDWYTVQLEHNQTYVIPD